MNDYWVSYYVPDRAMSRFELHSPWWVSGYADSEYDDVGETIVVAAIRAENEAGVAKVFRDAFDHTPEFRERFIEPLDRSPFSDRFPRAEWMEWTETSTCKCPEHRS